MPDTITLKSMRFHTFVGVYPHELEIPQPLEIDLSVDIQDSFAEATAEREVVDYAELYRIVAGVVNAGHIGYIEDVAERIAELVLKVRGVLKASVAVRKPHVALPGPLDYSEIAITRPRSAPLL